MPDALIWNLPSEDVAALDEPARAAGLSRADFTKLDQVILDLDDTDVMEDAWS